MLKTSGNKVYIHSFFLGLGNNVLFKKFTGNTRNNHLSRCYFQVQVYMYCQTIKTSCEHQKYFSNVMCLKKPFRHEKT